MVSRTSAQPADAARVCALRPDLSGGFVARSGPCVPRTADPARGGRASMRPLQHGEDPVQVRRWLGADAVPQTRAGGTVARLKPHAARVRVTAAALERQGREGRKEILFFFASFASFASS